MNELKSYTEYAVSTPTADFVIGFDFNYGEDAVNVTVDDVPANEAGYTVVYLNETTIRLSPSVPSGVVRLQRETDIDQTDHAYRAGAKFIAQTMDENFEQLRHSQQEVRDGFNKLADDTYEIIDTLQEVGQSAQDAADAAEVAAGLANDAAAQVNGKVSYEDFNNKPHNAMLGRDAEAAHPTGAILDGSGETQQQVNYNGGSKWHSRVDGYKLNERIVLTNGDIVKSTVDGNTNDPNVAMMGWINPEAEQKEINNKLKNREVWLEDYPQIKFDGTTEDGVAIQAILQPITDEGVIVHFKKNAKCLIGSSTVKGLFLGLKKNWTFDLNGCEILRGSPRTPLSYNSTIELVLCERTKFINGSINGQNELHGGVEGQCHNIALYGCKLTTFHDFISHHAVCDNLYQTKINPNDYRDNGSVSYTNTGELAVNTSVFLVNSQFLYGYRQGMTIGVSKNIFAVNCSFSYTGKSSAGGVSPTAGIDSEPNATGIYNFVENITFINCEFIGNGGAGCVVDHRNFSAHFTNCSFVDNDYSGLSTNCQSTSLMNCRFVGNNKLGETHSAIMSMHSTYSRSVPRSINSVNSFFALNRQGDIRVSEGIFLNLTNSTSLRGSGNFLFVSADSVAYASTGGSINVDGLNIQGKQFYSSNAAEVIRAITLSTTVSIKNITASTFVLNRCAGTIGETRLRTQTTFQGVEVGDIVDWAGVPAGTKVTGFDEQNRYAYINGTVTITTQEADVKFITPNPQAKFAYITNSPNVTEFKNLNLKGFSLVHDSNITLTGDRSRILLDGVLQKELCGYRDATITTRSIAANSSYTSTSFTLSGARLGDIVQVSANSDLLGCLISAYVSANNSIKVLITNPTSAAITIPDVTLKLRLTVLPS